ncbi:MAG TPA: DUF2059 domain-containing protein [Allosphingosinicella sp.]|nr:DUF2059 domain-containing protein [Allosphingosinicella sp.]
MIRALLAALAFAAGAPLAKAEPSVPAQAPQPVSASAAALAEVVVPADRFTEIEVSVTRQGLIAAFTQELGADWQTQYPDLLEAIWKDTEPELRRLSARNRPMLMQRLAALYTARLTESETTTLAAFYRSPTGQKMIRVMYEQADYSPMVKDMLAHDRGEVSAQALRATHESGKARLFEQLSEADKTALVELARTLPIAKMRAVGAEVQRLTVEWINEPDPEMEASIERVMAAATERYFEEHPR